MGTSEAAALTFVQRWQKQRLAHYTSRKPLNISFADVQGRDSNLWELKKKRVKRVKMTQCQPLVFDQRSSPVSLDYALDDLTRKAETMKFFGCAGVISLSPFHVDYQAHLRW